MKFFTCAKDFDFKMPITYLEKNSINNEDALNNRFCLVIIEKGSGIIKIGEKLVTFIAPVIFCVNEKENINIDEDFKAHMKIIYFHPSLINSILDFSLSVIQDSYIMKVFIERNEKFYGKIDIGPITIKRILGLCELLNNQLNLQDEENWPCRSRSYVMEILFLIENLYSKIDFKNNTIILNIDEDIYPILAYLNANYNKNITIPDLTKKFNINRTTLSEKFSKCVGESIISYLNRLRINIASILLRDTKLPVCEVMERVGFNENTHFLRTFKKYVGMSPRDYRDKYCWLT